MKKVIKIVLGAFLFFIIFWICIYVGLVLFNFHKLNQKLEDEWDQLFKLSTERVVETNRYLANKNNISLDSIKIVLNRNIIIREKYKKECSLDFEIIEYNFDKLLVNLIDSTKSNTFFELKEMIYENNSKLKIVNERYNDIVTDYNEYYYMFPNFIIGKLAKYKPKNHFSIKYGIVNKDPRIRANELPEWAIGVDTTFVK